MTEPRSKSEGDNCYIRLTASTDIEKGKVVLWDGEWQAHNDLMQYTGGAFAVSVKDVKAGEEGWFQTRGAVLSSQSDLCVLFAAASQEDKG